MATQRQIEANRRNAKLSTGPKTAEGKARSSQNAYKHGLTSKTLRLEGEEDRAQFQRFTVAFRERFKPADAEQTRIVETMLPIAWQMQRLAALEADAMIQYEREHRRRGEASIDHFVSLDLEALRRQRKTAGVSMTRALVLAALRQTQAATQLPMLTFGRYEFGLESKFFRLLVRLGKLQQATGAAKKFLARSNPKTQAAEEQSDAAA